MSRTTMRFWHGGLTLWLGTSDVPPRTNLRTSRPGPGLGAAARCSDRPLLMCPPAALGSPSSRRLTLRPCLTHDAPADASARDGLLGRGRRGVPGAVGIPPAHPSTPRPATRDR